VFADALEELALVHQALLRQFNPPDAEMLRLSVCGTSMATNRRTLYQHADSVLTQLFSPLHEQARSLSLLLRSPVT